MLDEIEQVKRDTIREVKLLPAIKIEDKETEPLIVVDNYKNQIRIIVNSNKKYRVLNDKNIILQALDILIVDSIKEILKNLAENEEKFERESFLQKFKEEVGGKNGKIRKFGATSDDDTKSGQSGTETSERRFL